MILLFSYKNILIGNMKGIEKFKKHLILNSRIKSAVKFDRTFYFNYFNLSNC